jgi:hypothetical protein
MNKIFYALVITFFVAAPAQAEPLYPLEVGMYWTYQVGDVEKSVTNRIVSSKNILGNEWFQLNEFGDTFWIRNSDKGQVEAINLWGTGAENVTTIEELLVYKYPYQVGETYMLGEDSITIETEKTVTVPAGSFQCTPYRIQMNESDYSISCIAQGVGVVENEFMNQGRLSVSRLLEYGRK